MILPSAVGFKRLCGVQEEQIASGVGVHEFYSSIRGRTMVT